MPDILSNRPILKNGLGQPYLALFTTDGIPIKNNLTGIPLGAYISQFNYKYTEEEENLGTLTLDTGNPDTVDIADLQEKSIIFLQWGYIMSDGSSISSPLIALQVRDFDALFDDKGTHITLKCIDSTNRARGIPPFKSSEDEDSNDTLSNFMDQGLGSNIGIVIQKFY